MSPVSFETKELLPTAVLSEPVVLADKALLPIAVLELPLKLPSSKAAFPHATFDVPVG